MTGRYVPRRGETRRRGGRAGRGGEGGIGSGCLFAKSPLSPCGSERRRKRRRRSGTVERNGQQYCRRGPGDLRGADRKGLAGAARVTREINYTLLEVLTSDRTPEADCTVRDPPRLFPPRRVATVLLFSDDENRLRFFSRERSDAPVASICRRHPLRCLPLFETI